MGREEEVLIYDQKNQNSDPISGISSEGYKGKGMVQSAPKKKE
jgi:hypothetical protein